MELSPNTLAFIGLSNEFCTAVENVGSQTLSEFVATMTRLLPRIYIAATDLKTDALLEEEYAVIDPYLEEDYYESIRRQIESAMGAEDVYLEVFEEDMKYSETPIGMSLAEGIADIFQVLYNFIMNVKDAPAENIEMALLAIKEDFEAYWGQRLCNIMRPLNHLRYNHTEDDED